MSVKIRVSYQSEEELERVLQLLQKDIFSIKTAKEQRGGYSRAYIRLRDPQR